MAASSQAYGQLIEKDQDQAMKRTKNRPMPMERISKQNAALITSVTGFGALALLSQIGLGPTAVGSAIWLGYGLVYMPAKQKTRFNTHIGS